MSTSAATFFLAGRTDPPATLDLLHRRSELLASLTQQESNVLDLIALGLTNREISNLMFLSEKTVKNYVTRLLQKCQVRNRTEAAILLLQGSSQR